MKNIFEPMKKCPLFEKMDDEELNVILKSPHTKIQDFSKNQTVISEGSSADCVGIILCGSVQIVRNDYFGNRSIIALINSPQIFAEVFVFANINAMPVSVVSVTDSRIMLIKPKNVLSDNPDLSSFYTKLTRLNLQPLFPKLYNPRKMRSALPSAVIVSGIQPRHFNSQYIKSPSNPPEII